MPPLLLDTGALILTAEGEDVAAQAAAALDAAHGAGVATYVSPMSAFEIGRMVATDRLRLLIRPDRWFAQVLEVPGVTLAPLTPTLLIAASALPGAPPHNVADCILIATARDLGATLVTGDRVLLDYGAQGHVRVLAC